MLSTTALEYAEIKLERKYEDINCGNDIPLNR